MPASMRQDVGVEREARSAGCRSNPSEYKQKNGFVL